MTEASTGVHARDKTIGGVTEQYLLAWWDGTNTQTVQDMTGRCTERAGSMEGGPRFRVTAFAKLGEPTADGSRRDLSATYHDDALRTWVSFDGPAWITVRQRDGKISHERAPIIEREFGLTP